MHSHLQRQGGQDPKYLVWMRAWGKIGGLGRGRISVSRRRGGCCQLAPFPALPFSCTVISLGSGPNKKHIGGFPQCITDKVKPAVGAVGARPWGRQLDPWESRWQREGKGSHCCVNRASSWRASGERARVKGEARQNHTHSQRHTDTDTQPATQTQKQRDTT